MVRFGEKESSVGSDLGLLNRAHPNWLRLGHPRNNQKTIKSKKSDVLVFDSLFPNPRVITPSAQPLWGTIAPGS
eukprot:COSAG06_NODE_30223_length_542_cov_1.654628_1_plen_73_part_10